MANNEFVEVVSSNAEKQVDDLIKKLQQLGSEINKINSNKINLPSDSRNNSSSTTGINNQSNKLLIEQERLINRISDAKKREAIENAKLRLELAKLNSENKKAAQEALGVLTSYQKLSAELNELRGQAKATAADMFILEQAGEQNSDQYRQLSATYDNVSQRVNLLHTNLTRIDRSLGDHRREVGNYENGWNGLSNAINQLTREAPAFANSLQTGFMAISNNLPTLIDELNQLREQNNRLRAEGRPTQSVLGQLARAFFSWQTVMSIGITLLTLYGSKLIEFISNAGSAVRQLDLLGQAQERYNNTVSDTITQSQEQYNTLNKLQTVIASSTKSEEEKADAREKLMNMFPAYFKSESDIINNTEAYQKATKELTKDILERAGAEAKQRKAAETLKMAADIEEEIAIRERTNRELLRIDAEYGGKYAEQERERIKAIVDARKEALKDNAEFQELMSGIGQAETGSTNLLGGYDPSAIHNLKKRMAELRELYKQHQAEVDKMMVNSYKLEVDADEEAKELQYENMVDFEASRYELIKTRLENAANAERLILEDENKSYEKRERANERYHQIQVQLAQNAYNEEIRLLQKNIQDETKELTRRVKDGEITERNKNAVVYSLQKQFEYDSLTAYEKYAENIREVNRSLSDSLKGVWDKQNLQKAENMISQKDLNVTNEYAKSLQDIVKNSKDYQEIEKAQKEFAIANREITKSQISLDIERLEKERDAEVNSERRLELTNQLITKQKELSDVTVKEAEEQAASMERLQKATESYLRSFTDGFLADAGLNSLNTFLKIEENGKTMFENLIAGANSAGEKFAVAFNAISEVVQETFNFLVSQQQSALEGTLAQIDMEQRLAERFALTQEARQQIQDQADAKRREARRKEAEQQKELALFNAIINTAQAVVGALPNIPLSVIVGALGAAQIALIASQDIPQFKDGVRNFGGGLAVVGDGGRSEIVRTKDGNLWRTPSTDTLVNLPKGSDVFRSEADFLRNSGTLLGGLPHINGDGAGISEGALKRVMGEVMSGAATNVITVDKRGVTAYAQSLSSKAVKFNNTVTFKSLTIN